MTGVSIRERRKIFTHRDTVHMEEGHVKTEAEIVVMLQQAKELAAKDCQQPPETSKRQGKILP